MPVLTLISFVFFTGLVAFVTWRLTRGHHVSDSSLGYFLAGRGLTGGFIAGSLLLTNLSTEQLVGLNGVAFNDGLCVMAWEVVAALSLVLMALWFLPRYLKSGIATIPQLLEERFDAGTRWITTVIFILAYAGILLPMVLYTGARGLIDVLDLGALTGIENDTTLLWIAVWFIGVVGSIYAIFGGLRSVAVSDTLNGFGLLVGGVMIAWFALAEVGGDAGVVAGFETVREAHPDKFNSLGGRDASVPFGTLFTGVLLLNLFYWTTNQQIIQRTFAASSLAEGQRGVLMAGVLKVLAPLILVLPGIVAFHLYADEGITSDQAYGTLVNAVLPDWLVGFFAAALVGAILSSFNSALNSTATLFSLGVWRRGGDDAASERSTIRAGKICGAVVAILSMSVAPLLANTGEGIFQFLQKMNALYFVPIFSVVLVGLLHRRVPAIAAKVALVVGLGAIAAGYFVFGVGFAEPRVDWASHWDRDTIHEFHFIAIVFAVLCLLQVGIAAVRPRSEPWRQVGTDEVDLTPWRFAWPAGIALVAFVLLVYIGFADTSVL